MKYQKLGNSDLNVSQICLGCMSFGIPSANFHTWLLDEKKSHEIIKKALDYGINFFDTANMYGGGSSEQFLGSAIKKYAKREDVIIATKVYYNEGKLSREAIFREVDDSLKRLQMDYIDLLVIHRFDYDTDILETMQALHDVILTGKVRYIGASAMYAYQFAKMQECAKRYNLTPFISMQNHYNLIYREEEREMMKLLIEENVSSTPYSPFASGRLARNWDGQTKRALEDKYGPMKYDKTKDVDIEIVKRIKEIADKYNVSQAEIAFAWVLHKKPVVSPILGVTKIEQLDQVINAIDLKLSQVDLDYLEELYIPHNVVGAIDKK